MVSKAASRFALFKSREEIAVISQYFPFCMAGITLFTPIFAVLRTPQLTLFFNVEI